LRVIVRVVLVAALGTCVFDATRPPARQVSVRLAIAGIHYYQRSLAPLAASTGVACRFTPSCSRYAETVISRDGIVRGGWLTARRIVRCGPWTRPGTQDPP
jgi:hypothetical protein